MEIKIVFNVIPLPENGMKGLIWIRASFYNQLNHLTTRYFYNKHVNMKPFDFKGCHLNTKKHICCSQTASRYVITHSRELLICLFYGLSQASLYSHSQKTRTRQYFIIAIIFAYYSRPSCLYRRNPLTWNDHLYVETGLRRESNQHRGFELITKVFLVVFQYPIRHILVRSRKASKSRYEY